MEKPGKKAVSILLSAVMILTVWIPVSAVSATSAVSAAEEKEVALSAVLDPVSITTEIYEIKHSAEMVPEQYKNLVDEEKCRATEFRFGTITKKAVIYRGEDAIDGDIQYLNVENYLRSLGA